MKLFVRLLCIGWHLGSGLLQVALLFRFLSKKQKQTRIRVWSSRLLAICGVEVKLRGLPPPLYLGGHMLVANHISWLDIFALNAVMPSRFIAKAEVEHWPLVGYLARQVGTLFVTRERNGGTQDKIMQAARILQQDDNLMLFPEGTTSIGDKLLPFKASFFQTALDTQSAIWPVLCRYTTQEGGLNADMAYCGETSLWQSLCLILKQPQSSYVVLDFLPPVAAQGSRRALADKVYMRLACKLAEPVDLVQTVAKPIPVAAWVRA